ncbi:unnamed protein product [Arctogadus glacialis]
MPRAGSAADPDPEPIPCDQLKLAVLFSVPFDRVIYRNWFAIGLFDSKTKCDHNLYPLMYYGHDPRFVRGEGGGCTLQYKGEYVVIQADMSNTGTALLRVDVSDRKEEKCWLCVNGN